jgi:hypothetical protein
MHLLLLLWEVGAIITYTVICITTWTVWWRALIFATFWPLTLLAWLVEDRDDEQW